MIGDGIVSLRLPDGSIFHPVLVRRVQFEYDLPYTRFRVVDLDKPTELYTALFSVVSDINGQSLAQCKTELEAGDYHPLAKEANTFLKRFAVTLSPQGTLVEDGRPPKDAEYPVIGRSPVLFLRSEARVLPERLNSCCRILKRRRTYPVPCSNRRPRPRGIRRRTGDLGPDPAPAQVRAITPRYPLQ